MMNNNTSSNAVSCPSSRLPSARRTSQTKKNTMAARAMISTALLRNDPGLERPSQLVSGVISRGNRSGPPPVTLALEVKVEGHDEGVAARRVEVPDRHFAGRGRGRWIRIHRVALEEV